MFIRGEVWYNAGCFRDKEEQDMDPKKHPILDVVNTPHQFSYENGILVTKIEPGRAEGVQANLYVCEDVLAGGDIFCPGADGFQAPLAFPVQE